MQTPFKICESQLFKVALAYEETMKTQFQIQVLEEVLNYFQ